MEEEDLVGGFVHWKVILLLAVILLSLCISALGIVMQILPVRCSTRSPASFIMSKAYDHPPLACLSASGLSLFDCPAVFPPCLRPQCRSLPIARLPWRMSPNLHGPEENHRRDFRFDRGALP